MSKFHRLIRYDWPLHFVLLLTNWLPDNVPFLRLRGWLASHFLGSCGKGLELGRSITFYNPSKIEIGNNVYIAYGCWFMAGGKIRIEDEVLFGPYSVIVSSDHIRKASSYRYGSEHTAPITIRNGCWIAAHVTVTAGTLIGQGTVVAAGAVVRGEMPSNSLVAGQPARVIKTLE